MEAEERERFYDDEVAPVLKDLAQKCQLNGLSLIAMTEWEPGETGRTVALAKNSGIGIRMAEMAMKCHGNVDSFIFAMLKHGQEHGHSSICLRLLEREADTLPKG